MSYPIGYRVVIKGHDDAFVVDGYWRGYVRVAHVAFGTTHCVSHREIVHVQAVA